MEALEFVLHMIVIREKENKRMREIEYLKSMYPPGIKMLQNYVSEACVQTATFRGQQGRISRPVRAILSGQF